MPRFSANLGFLWADLPLPDAIDAAARAGFDAVEFHWPYDVPAETLRLALAEVGLPLLGLNTSRGNVDAGDNGLAAVPGRTAETRAAIDQAIAYAAELSAEAVHVMAGRANGPDAKAHFLEALEYACDRAAPHNLTILIEALNPFDAPGYFLNSTTQAAEIIATLQAPNLKLMFDCYHVGRSEGDPVAILKPLLPIVGHIQFAAVPDRGVPDHGEIDYRQVFRAIDQFGWQRPLGAEYRPGGPTERSLDWLVRARKEFCD